MLYNYHNTSYIYYKSTIHKNMKFVISYLQIGGVNLKLNIFVLKNHMPPEFLYVNQKQS